MSAEPDGGSVLAEAANGPFTKEDVGAVRAVLRSGWLSMGPSTLALEAAVAAELGATEAVALGSAVAALQVALLAAGVMTGDEVIIPALAGIPTVGAVIHTGGLPVLADIGDPPGLGADPEAVERRIRARTRAVVVEHVAGFPAPADRLAALCDRHGIVLVEAGAGPAGGKVGGRRVGSWGHAAMCSFDGDGLVPGCEGGILVTSDDGVVEEARRLRSHGMTAGSWSKFIGRSRGYDAVGLGYNFRLDEPRAALALSRLGRLRGEAELRRKRASAAHRRLSALPGWTVPCGDALESGACHALPVVCTTPAGRERVRRRAWAEHRLALPVVPPALHELSALRGVAPIGTLPRAEHAGRAGLLLPLDSDEHLHAALHVLEEDVVR